MGGMDRFKMNNGLSEAAKWSILLKRRGENTLFLLAGLCLRWGSGFKKVKKEEMVFEEGVSLTGLLNTVVHPFLVYLSASCLPIKLFLYFLNLYYKFETARGEAAPIRFLSDVRRGNFFVPPCPSFVVQDVNRFQKHAVVLTLRTWPVHWG